MLYSTDYTTHPIKSILFVDDDEDDLLLFKSATRTIDHRITVATALDGAEALAFLKNCTRKPDIIFLDLNMPKLNGFECLSALSKADDLRAVPVVILTTSASEKDKTEAMILGAKAFITKPNSYLELQQILTELIQSEAVPNAQARH
jgi:CheY-like chemotaxis protein